MDCHKTSNKLSKSLAAAILLLRSLGSVTPPNLLQFSRHDLRSDENFALDKMSNIAEVKHEKHSSTFSQSAKFTVGTSSVITIDSSKYNNQFKICNL